MTEQNTLFPLAGKPPRIYSTAKGLAEMRNDKARARGQRQDPDYRHRKRQFPSNTREAQRQQYTERLVKSFGLTKEEYEAMLEKQNHCCAICEQPERRQGKTRLSLDHCHAHGHFRGLLCMSCNSILGFAEDDIERLYSAIKYLERTAKPTLEEVA